VLTELVVGEVDGLEQLRQLEVIDEDNAADAERIFAQTRRLPVEGRAIEMLLAHHARKPLPEALLVAVASALMDRGDDRNALAALAHASSTSALLLRSDGLARTGDRAGALALVERVLLRDIDSPGARERHVRWAAARGWTVRPAAPLSQRADGAGAAAGTSTAAPLAADAAAGGASPFRRIRERARGGAGVVYEAEDVDLGRRVALKVYHRPERDRAQLAHEARVAAGLAGPGVVRVWDAHLDEGWLAMEWAPKGALGALGSNWPPLTEWAPALARALARVHRAGWVHLDVKPANVLLHATASAVLTDFGTARRIGEPSPPGSLGYVSPERLGGQPSDPRDDVYGFGRIVADFLAQTNASALDASGRAGWHALAADCTAPRVDRPADGGALVAQVRACLLR
jgi:hypothetical protein